MESWEEEEKNHKKNKGFTKVEKRDRKWERLLGKSSEAMKRMIDWEQFEIP